MDFVVETSIASSWFLVDQQTTAADLMSERLAAAAGRVPALFWFDIGSIPVATADRRPASAVLVERVPLLGPCAASIP